MKNCRKGKDLPSIDEGFQLLYLCVKMLKYGALNGIFAVQINLMRFFSFLAVFSIVFQLQAQQGATARTSANTPMQKPRLVVGIMVDQMRWDYLYRYYDRYAANGGFKRMLNQGFSCENTFINYAPTVTTCGHTSVYTGTVPAVHGITGNSWYDYEAGKMMYCSEDKSVKTVGSTSAAGEMSPRNMLTTTICDELRLATNFRSKVIGIAIKDRGGILPAGHSANAAYWYDTKNGNWITSTYYKHSMIKSMLMPFMKRAGILYFPSIHMYKVQKTKTTMKAGHSAAIRKDFLTTLKNLLGKTMALSHLPLMVIRLL